MKRTPMFALLAVMSVLAGCSGGSGSQDPNDPNGGSAPTGSTGTNNGNGNGDDTSTSSPSGNTSTNVPSSVEPSGIYWIKGSTDYTWLAMDNGYYGAWAAGAACNTDFSTAPASCLTGGTYVINESQAEIQFTDGATGVQVVSPYQVSAFANPGTITTQNNGGSKGSGSQKPVATAWNLKKCVLAAATACSLYWGYTTGSEPDEPPEPPVIELPVETGKKTA